MVPTDKRESGRIGPPGLAPCTPISVTAEMTIWYARLEACARTRDGLSNSLRALIEQRNEWQTINLRGHEF
jgi:hypothetical protein